MNRNAGNGDRIFRVIAGVLILAAGIYFKSYWGIVGLIPLLTAVIGWCPLNVPFGISTKKNSI